MGPCVHLADHYVPLRPYKMGIAGGGRVNLVFSRDAQESLASRADSRIVVWKMEGAEFHPLPSSQRHTAVISTSWASVVHQLMPRGVKQFFLG